MIMCPIFFTKNYVALRNQKSSFYEHQMTVPVCVSVFISPQDSRSVAGTEDKETFLVTLTKPCLYVQQVAFDKGEHINWSHSYKETTAALSMYKIKEFIFSLPNYCEFMLLTLLRGIWY